MSRGLAFSCCLGECGRVAFCCLGGPGRGACVFVAVWEGSSVCFCCLGRGAVGAGDGSSLSYRPAWIVFEGHNNSKGQSATKDTGSP